MFVTPGMFRAGRLAPFVAGTALLLTSCGGSGDTSQSLASEAASERPSDSSGVPNFAVTDFLAPRAPIDSYYSFAITVANVGEVGATVPDGWIMTSLTEDFSSGFAEKRVALVPRIASDDRTLEPGEETLFDASADFDTRFLLPMYRGSELYVRFRLNPDMALVFNTPGDVLAEHREILESDYTDNESTTATITNSSLECMSDALEENDTLGAAALITPDTSYTVGNCDDSIDVFAIDLLAGQAYEIHADENHYRLGTAKLSVLDPNGRYLIKRKRVAGVFRASIDGRHHIVLHSDAGLLDDTTNLEIRTQTP